MNPCNPFVWNAVVIGKQLTMIFHTHNSMLTHYKPQVVTDHVKLLDQRHVQKDPLKVTRGKAHECLDMTIDFRNRSSTVLSQHYDAKKFWNSILECLRRVHKTSPALENLFKADSDSPRIEKEKQDQHHSITAKFLHFSQRSRADLQLETGFHFTIVK